MTRRTLLGAGIGALAARADRVARIAITLDLEMSANFPTWDQTHWNYEKGNLDWDTKDYAIRAAELVAGYGAHIHFFAVGRVFEQEDVRWLERIARGGHPIGNHTYDHVNVLARTSDEIQYRFRRAPWLIEGRGVEQVLEENIRMTTVALQKRIGVEPAGFRTPGGFPKGLSGRPDVQRMLMRQGFRWVSGQYPGHAESLSGTQPFFYPETKLLEIPMSPVSDIGAFRNGRWTLDRFLESTRGSLHRAIEHSAVFDFLGHPSCLLATDPSMKTIELICRTVKQAGERARLVTLNDIAREHLT
jgi:peptidoglycan/xylan/chitin deacetylase (PgdA/CDA1 family)